MELAHTRPFGTDIQGFSPAWGTVPLAWVANATQAWHCPSPPHPQARQSLHRRPAYPAPQQLVGRDAEGPPVHRVGVAGASIHIHLEDFRGCQRQKNVTVHLTSCSSSLRERTWARNPAFFFFLGPYLWRMEVLRLWVQSELQLPAYTTATATQDPSHICNSHCSLWQRRILNPPSEARDQTHILMDISWVLNPLATTGTPRSPALQTAKPVLCPPGHVVPGLRELGAGWRTRCRHHRCGPWSRTQMGQPECEMGAFCGGSGKAREDVNVLEHESWSP